MSAAFSEKKHHQKAEEEPQSFTCLF